MPRSRAHHYVPQVYLRQWAEDGKVAVRRRGKATTFVTSTRRVAQETDLYTIETDDGPSDFVERSLASMESSLPDVFAAVRRGRVPPVGTVGRDLCARLVALQFIRTPDRVEEQRFPDDAFEAAGRSLPVPREVVGKLLRDRWGYPPTASELQGAWDFVNVSLRDGVRLTNADYLEVAFRTLPKLADRLAQMRWSTEASKGLPFITSDQPLNLWVRRPKSLYGVGAENAEEIRIPVGPRHLLVLRHRGAESSVVVPRRRVISINAHIAATCRHMVIGQPTRVDMLEVLRLHDRRPMWKFNEGPLYHSRPRGDEYRGEVIHFYRPYDDRDMG